jgi:hypothetical protein
VQCVARVDVLAKRGRLTRFTNEEDWVQVGDGRCIERGNLNPINEFMQYLEVILEFCYPSLHFLALGITMTIIHNLHMPFFVLAYLCSKHPDLRRTAWKLHFTLPPSIANVYPLPHAAMLDTILIPGTHGLVRDKTVLAPHFLHLDRRVDK